MRCYCTYLDRNYLARGLALYRSLREHSPGFTLWVLCMDDEAHAALTRLNLPEVEPIALRDFEHGDAALLAAKGNRSRLEYYFTCTPSLPLYILRQRPAVELITYLDADLYFFADPEPLFDELGSGSVAIIGHRFPQRLRQMEGKGTYNVGWLSFRRDDNALGCLARWREQCLAWCYDREEDGRFADQKYLDDWPARVPGVVVLQHPGANLAPWNVDGGRLRLSNRGAVLVDGEPLVFFHFHGLREITRWLYDPGWAWYGVVPSPVLREQIYNRYLRELRAVRPLLPPAAAGGGQLSRNDAPGGRGTILAALARRAGTLLRDLPGAWRRLSRRRYIVVGRLGKTFTLHVP